MARNNDGFNLDDMMEIFGESAVAPPAAAAIPVSAPPSAPKVPSIAPSEEALSSDEQALLGAYEKRKQDNREQEEARRIQEQQEAHEREEQRIIDEFERAKAAKAAAAASAAPAPAPVAPAAPKAVPEPAAIPVPALAPLPALAPPPVLAPPPALAPIPALASIPVLAPPPGHDPIPVPETAQPLEPPPPVEFAPENEAFCAMLDETRAEMIAFLVPLIGIRATNNMLNKSVEKARSKAPVVLKDANWRMDGTLREDGSVDPERLLKNAISLPEATRMDEYLAGLRELVGLRIRAVEAGLGTGPCAEMKAKLVAIRGGMQNLSVPVQEEWIEAFYSRVLA